MAAVANNPKHTVPIIDFGRFLHGSPDDRKTIAAELDNALRTVGFLQLKNHGVPAAEVEECFRWSAEFFALPESEKMKSPHPPGGSHHRGYSGLGLEKVSQNVFDEAELKEARTVPDYKESYESGNVDDPYQPNIWPPEDVIPGFREFMQRFFGGCAALVRQLLRCLAVALELPDVESLSDTHAQELFQLRLLHYPSLPLRLLKEQRRTRIGAHSDFGTLTLLFQDAVGGLEIQDPNEEGRFQAVQPVEGACLVNIGDLMERWSNGRWRSTVHRVGQPPTISSADGKSIGAGEGAEEMCAPRYSIPFFSVCDPDTVIDALPGCWSEENPKKYEPVTTTEYVQMRMATLYDS